MATKSITITDDAGRFDAGVTALCANYNYQENVPNPGFDPSKPEDPDANPKTVPNPQTPDQFAGQCLVNFTADNVRAYANRVGDEHKKQVVDGYLAPLAQGSSTVSIQ